MENQSTQSVTPTKGRSHLKVFIALAVVILAWAGAFAMRRPVALEGWQDGLAAGQEVALTQDKTMVVLFTASWCGPCKQLKRDVLHDPAVEDRLLEGFVPIVCDLTDTSKDNPNMADFDRMREGDGGIPYVVALSPQGQKFSVFRGQRTPEAFLVWLDEIEK